MGPDLQNTEHLDDALRAAGLRLTQQRRMILNVVLTADDHPDALEVHRRVQADDASVSLATVYRTLAALSEKGVLQKLNFDGEPSRFETAETQHHDHIIDVDDGRIVEFTSPEIERLQRQIAKAHGYEIVSHRMELYCRKAT